MDVNQARQFKAVQKENARLKKLVAELSLDSAILKETLRPGAVRLGVRVSDWPLSSTSHRHTEAASRSKTPPDAAAPSASTCSRPFRKHVRTLKNSGILTTLLRREFHCANRILLRCEQNPNPTSVSFPCRSGCLGTAKAPAFGTVWWSELWKKPCGTFCVWLY
jgi:hypothetical protein